MVAATTMGMMSLTPASHADDDYPYPRAGPVPARAAEAPPPRSGADPSGPSPDQAGPPRQAGHPGKPRPPGHPNKPGQTDKPDPPPPPRECAKHIWYYQGSYGDPWGFALRNCTSFVAWRLREANGFADFNNHMDGGSYGNAENWDDNAEALGYLVDDVPAVGAVAQTDDGRVGHVTWVQSVGDGTVTVEEYNYAERAGTTSGPCRPRTSATCTSPTSPPRRHSAPLARRPRRSTPRGAPGGARSTPTGTLLAGGPVRLPLRLGSEGAWTSDAAPAVTTDATGRTWVAAVSSTGTLFTAHTIGESRWSRPRPLGSGWSTTSSPALAADASGRLHLFAVTADGTLAERVTTDLRWRRGARMGVPGTWATHTSPVVTTTPHGRLWLAAVTRHGALETRHQIPSGRWGRFDTLGHDWSISSTPALAGTDNGRLWLAAVTSRGELSLRSTTGPGAWHAVASDDDRWSPYSSPALAADSAGRMWLAAEHLDGRVVVRATTSAHHPVAAGDRARVRRRDREHRDRTPRGGRRARGGPDVRPAASLVDRRTAEDLDGRGCGAHGGGFSASLQQRMP